MANVIFNQFNGLADSKWSGIKGSFYKMVGLDIHSTPGTITVQQKLSLDSSNVVTEFCRVALSVSTGDQLYFSYTSGKIWRRTAGSYTLVYTTAAAAGNSGCLGAMEFNGYVYWATQSRLHRTAITDLVGFVAVNLNWQTFTNTDAEFHPMIVQNGTLFIGDGNNVAKVDSGSTFTAACWTTGLVAPLRIKSMEPEGIDLVIGTIITQAVNFCQIVEWDTIQTTWQFANPVNENGINAFFHIYNKLIAQAGTAGMLYAVINHDLVPFNRIPGTWTPTQYGEVYPNSVGNLRGIPMFGFSNSPAAANSVGNPADQGIYTYGTYSKNYPEVLNGPEYVISQNVTSGVEIGAILVEGSDLYVAWKNGASFGVDKLDYSNKYGSAYLEGLVITPNPMNSTVFQKIFATYQSLPASTALTFKYKKNHAAAYTTLTNVIDAANFLVINEMVGTVEARAFQFRIEFTVNGNNAPVVEELGLEYVKIRVAHPRGQPSFV